MKRKKKRSSMVDGGPVPTWFIAQMKRRKRILKEMEVWLASLRVFREHEFDKAEARALLAHAERLLRLTLGNRRVMP